MNAKALRDVERDAIERTFELLGKIAILALDGRDQWPCSLNDADNSLAVAVTASASVAVTVSASVTASVTVTAAEAESDADAVADAEAGADADAGAAAVTRGELARNGKRRTGPNKSSG